MRALLACALLSLGVTPQQGPWLPSAGSIALPEHSEDGRTLLAVLDDYAERTGHRFVMPAALRMRLDRTRAGLRRSLDIPPDAVHSVVGALLRQHGVGLTLRSEVFPEQLVLFDLLFQTVESHEVPSVDLEDLDAHAENPAALVSTVLMIEHLDARRIATWVRALMVNSRYQSVHPLGPRALVLRGHADVVRDQVELLRAADRAHGAYLAEHPEIVEQEARIRAAIEGKLRRR